MIRFWLVNRMLSAYRRPGGSSSLNKALWRKFAPPVFLIIYILFIGTTGYVIIEGWSPFEAVYMTVITIGTVGYSEVVPLSHTGKIFTIFVIPTVWDSSQ